MTVLYLLVFLISVTGISYASYNFYKIKRMKEGTELMQEIALSIREGADTFLFQEYKIIIPVALIISLIFAFIYEASVSFAFILGILMSGATGYFGMKAATYANVRVANKARKSKNIGKTLKVALRGGSVMGLSVASFALLGLVILFVLFNGQLENLGTVDNGILEYVPFSTTITAYGLGCSVIAIFNRIGGGIYTKAADMGSDLVGKTELKLAEDDPRNPGVIADCVGDNVGDTAGLGSDLLESFMGSIVSGIVLILFTSLRYAALNMHFSATLLKKMYIYPILFCTLGLFSCIISLAWMLSKDEGKDPHKELNLCTWMAAGTTAGSTLVMTFMLLANENMGDLPFKFGFISPYLSALVGIVAGIIIGLISEYYTSEKYKPTKNIAEAAKEGHALVITEGLSVGMVSTFSTVLVLAMGLLVSYSIAGTIGMAMAAMGMLSFVSVTVSVDTYGPISDNAGGIAEMAGLNELVRKITDLLDSVGNTTAAIGKGFAIGAATFATVSMIISYLYSFTPITEEVTLDFMNVYVLSGAFVGSLIPFYVSGILIRSVAKTAEKMIDEIRRQFKEIPGLKEGKVKPDSRECVKIATLGALGEMINPSMIALLAPLTGFIFGPMFVAGILMGATISAVLLAIFCGNSGGAWDNAKKLIEASGKKGTPEHDAAVVGDTVGDPLKDTVGPSLDILIKIMSTEAIILGPLFATYNLVQIIGNWL